jgi:hypothetical protein
MDLLAERFKMSFGDETNTPYATSRGRDWPSVRQFNVFLENRVGGLLNVVRRFEQTDVRIISLIVNDLTDCAIIRLVLSDPERGLEILKLANLPVTESDLLVVELPENPQPLAVICKCLLAAEINIDYAYHLVFGMPIRTALALHVDDHEMAVNTLTQQGFMVFTENDLTQE